MHVIVGLGNPESRYAKTRHNAGFMVVDRLAARHAPGEPLRSRFHAGTVEARIGSARCVLVKPTTYVNRSGLSVSEAMAFYKADPASDLVVITDDVALEPGEIRIRASGGTGGHNGLVDIERALGRTDYSRIRIGIGATPPMMNQADYVLGRFTPEEWESVDPAIDRAADAAECIVSEGVTPAMNKFNTRSARGRAADEAPGDTHPGWLGETNDQPGRGSS
jgi:PTH1 family peptidyl-tRNA hydrolase